MVSLKDKTFKFEILNFIYVNSLMEQNSLDGILLERLLTRIDFTSTQLFFVLHAAILKPRFHLRLAQTKSDG